MPINKNREDYRFYKIWTDMKQRCLNPNCKKFYLYGGRGITISQDWLLYQNFYNDMWNNYLTHIKEFGEKQTTLDRVNENLGYSKSNCAWATYSEQNSHRSNNEPFKAISPDGKEYEARDKTKFGQIHNLKRQCILKCLNGEYKQHRGWKFERIF